MKKTLYTVKTTNPGADKPTVLYFDSQEKAQHFLTAHCDNGEVEQETVSYKSCLNYSDGCTYNELMYFDDEDSLWAV